MTLKLQSIFARLRAHRRQFDAKCLGVLKYLFGRGQVRSTLLALVLATVAPLSRAATDLSDLSTLNSVICLISGEVSGPWLYGIGLVLIIVGAVAIASSESTIVKLLSTVVIGFGIASAAVPILKNHFDVSYTCT